MKNEKKMEWFKEKQKKWSGLKKKHQEWIWKGYV